MDVARVRVVRVALGSGRPRFQGGAPAPRMRQIPWKLRMQVGVRVGGMPKVEGVRGKSEVRTVGREGMGRVVRVGMVVGGWGNENPSWRLEDAETETAEVGVAVLEEVRLGTEKRKVGIWVLKGGENGGFDVEAESDRMLIELETSSRIELDAAARPTVAPAPPLASTSSGTPIPLAISLTLEVSRLIAADGSAAIFATSDCAATIEAAAAL